MAKLTQLSTVQKTLIQKLQGGEVIHFLDGINPKVFYSKGLRTISIATVCKLEVLGFIERKNGSIILTEKGENLRT